MFSTITIVLALVALAAAAFAIVQLRTVSWHLSDLGRRVLDSQDIGRISAAAEKVETFESRMAGCERNADESQKQLAEFKTKVSELAAKAGAAEQIARRNEASLAELVPNIKALADAIQTIKKFQTATEKVHSMIQAALSDMQTSTAPADGLGTPAEAAKPAEASEGPQEWWQAGENETPANN